MLLRANQVVPTSQLLGALWTGDDAPASARKMLQNAVWGLRTVLASAGYGDEMATLTTRAPGYVLHVDPDRVDLHRFHRRAEEGRALLAARTPEKAADVLREALATWRGAALADLVESGTAWPELAAVEQTRLSTMEDYFDAELACGRHHSVLGELESLVDTEKLRERACGQLMLALYRCGRHADALSVYSRMRSALVEDLGLEPGPSLQKLQHAILTHDPTLALPPGVLPGQARVEVSASPSVRAVSEQVAATAQAANEGRARPEPAPEAPGIPPRIPRQRSAAQRRQVSIAIVSVRPNPNFADLDPAEVDNTLASVSSVVKVGIEQLGGTVSASIGSASLALFGAPRRYGNDELRAVRAVLMLRDCLSASRLAGPRMVLGEPGLIVRAAVVTGEALVRYRLGPQDEPPTVDGALIDKCQHLLGLVPGGEVWICDKTRQLTEDLIASRQPKHSPGGWRAEGDHPENLKDPATPSSEHESELAVMRGLLECTRERAKPQLVTVFGSSAAHVAGFLAEFERRMLDERPETIFLDRRIPLSARTGILAAQTEILTSICGIQRGDSAAVAAGKLAAVIRGSDCPDYEADWLMLSLQALLDPSAQERVQKAAKAETLLAWRRFLELAADDKPVVAVIDEVSGAAEEALDSVEELAEASGRAPLFVIVVARPELLDRRPNWGGGKRHTACITLDSTSDSAVYRLRSSILSVVDKETRRLARRVLGTALVAPGMKAGAGPVPDSLGFA
ncbi:BTAD domain-containing putative transcriptional regulator [Micromonospora sp. NPDC049523]|uniref:BTAD domain-containing putative transcriptional regulator n=1 Tax=Micromonospora sp. NPDC049523 TaxID=3155921 RepID=UPI003438625E